MNKNILSHRLFHLHLFLIAAVFPLFFTNYYYNIQLSKSMFFLITTFLFLIAQLLTSPSLDRAVLTARFTPRRTPAALFAVLFFLCTLISAFLSDFGLSCFTGADGRYMGVFTLLVMLVIFFLYASHSIDLCRSHYWLILGSSLVALLGILQFYHIDPVGFSLHVPDQYNGMYISTIGQINTFSGYIALTLAFTLSFYCLRGNRWLLLPSFIGFLALFIGNSDSGFLSLFTVIFLLPLFLPNQTAFCRLFDQLLLFNLTGLIAGGLSPFGLIPYQGFSARFSGFHFALPCLTAMGLLRLWIPHMRYPQAARFRPKRLYAFFLVTAILLFFLLTLCVNIGLIQCSPLLINDQWGSFRGFIWLKIIKIFQNAPLLNKLFGYGPDTLKPLLLTLCREEMLAITGKIYDSAHNDFLHYLITTGLSGSLTWLFFWFSVVIHTSRHYTQELLPWYLALIAYLVQTLLIPTQPITAPLGFLFAGICIGNSRTSSDCTKKRICHRIFRVL